MATIPEPRENDVDDVSLALEVAQTQWARGDYGEALKWLQKATNAAFEAEEDLRGMELSKAAAELAADLKNAKAPAQAPQQAENTEVNAPPPRMSAPAPVARPSTAAPPDVQHGPQAGSRRPPPVRPSAIPAPRRSAVRDDDEATREHVVTDAARGPGSPEVDEWPTESVNDLELIELPPSAPKRQQAETPAPQPAEIAPRPSVRPSSPRQPTGAIPSATPAAAAIPTTQALRVAVSRSGGRPSIRLLDNHGLRPGEHDAMLVALTGQDLTSLFKD